MARSAHQSAAAVRSLLRIRAYETTDGTGLRRVWHQGTDGADLLTWVNADGKVVRQEFTLLEDHFVWTPDGLRTAAVDEVGGSMASEASATVHFDAEISRQRVAVAHAALLSFTGEDKYVLNIRRILAKAMGELLEVDACVMTQNLPVPEGEALGPSGWSVALWVGAAVALVAVVTAVLLLH